MKIEFNKLSPKAILLGFLADNVGTMLFTFVLSIIAISIYAARGGNVDDIDALMKIYYSSVPLLLLTFVVGISFTVLGGYVAGRIARGYELINAISVGVADIVLVIFSMFGHATYPFWYHVIAFILTVPATYLGGVIAKRQNAVVVKN